MARITTRFQIKTLKRLEHVPIGVRCPRCHQGFEIVVSRKQIYSSAWNRLFFRFYRCCVCENRFCEWNQPVLRRLATIGVSILVVTVWLATTITH